MSLLRYVLNTNSSQVYDNDTNYGINEVSVEGTLRRSAAVAYDRQAFVDTGVGYQAFILSYENQGLNTATTGRENTSGGSETPPPQGGLLGELGKFYLQTARDGYVENPATQALGQINFLNDVRMKIWIPSIDVNLTPAIVLQESGAPWLVDNNLYQTCHIVDEQFLNSLPPPGSLISVDYENRKAMTGLTMRSVICTDANFARIIISEFSGITDVESLAQFFENVTIAVGAGSFSYATGDALSSLRPTPAMVSSEIMDLADNYDADTTIPGHGPSGGQHASHLDVMHPDMLPYAKAFLYKAWNDRQITIQINQVYRSPERSAEMIAEYERGEREIKPGTRSYHLLGMALDFNPTLQTGIELHGWDSPSLWTSSGIVSIGESVNLYWGGRFGTNYDPIHFDFRNIISTSKKNQLMEQSQLLAIAPNRIDTTIVV